MTIRVIHVRSFRGLLSALEGFALGSNRDEYVYRGHRNPSWRLTSSFARHVTTAPYFHGLAIEQLVSRFVHGLASIGNRELIGKD